MYHEKITKLIPVLVIALAVGACKSKPKNEAPTTDQAGAPVMDSQITSQPMDFDAQGSDSGRIEGLATIHFDYDRSVIPSGERAKLAQNAQWIKSHPGRTVQIEGHCDARGSVEYNLALGERRAKATYDALVALGVDGTRMNLISFGEEKPLVSGDSESVFAQNRRANFVPSEPSVNQLSSNDTIE